MTKNKFYKEKHKNMHIAVIGAGVSGLTIAMHLSKKHRVTLYEANNYLGGHALTLNEKILLNNKLTDINFDVGFLVYNNKNYPLFSELLNLLKVKSIDSSMSFSVANKANNFEYGSTGILSLTNNLKNIFKIRFWLLLKEINRFYKITNNILNSKNIDFNKTVNIFLQEHKFKDIFIIEHFLPMCAAIWSVPFKKVLKMPIKTILVFFKNHGLLSFFGKPQWKTILNGSKNYVNAITKTINGNIYINEKVVKVVRKKNNIIIKSQNMTKEFNKVIFATHADDTLKLIESPSRLEKAILTKCKYETNQIIIHQDCKLMPKNKKVWSSWNVLNHKQNNNNNICVTYWINKLQSIKSDKPILVTLNPQINRLPSKQEIIRKLSFRHPVLDKNYLKAQNEINSIQGKNNTYFTGAWLGYGFHEDGVKSSSIIAKKLNLIK